MHDIRLIRDEPDAFDQGLRSRGLEPLAAGLVALDDRRKSVVGELQAALERRNSLSKEVGQAKARKDEARAAELMAEVAALKERVPQLEAAEREASKALEDRLAEIPNIPKPDVPVGADEHGNVERHRVGTPKEIAGARQHFELGEAMGLMDFEAAAKLSGSRFVVLKGGLARLERALGQFMLDLHTTEHGYTEVAPPVLVRDAAVFGVAQLPKFEEDLFRTTDGFWLTSTAEVSLTNLVREAIAGEEELPLRFTALTPCFRSEAGSAGRDTRGMLRQHQFQKCELVSITTPETSEDEHERMLSCAEAVLKRLDLPFRTMTLCTGDMGFSSRKTYDIEVWLPGQGAYREISSCSVCGDFQARRMNARYRAKDAKSPRFVHTLNGSGIAVGRALIAVLENYQNPDGSVTVPAALVPYMGGLTRIEKAA
ncbi:serine--tRNA ligase [Salinarimonas soli]|uniref:Serine--tRNA ligase n=1 Tax=Salinarimonas soli TaxID=1638099 RepID=A0A5B2V9I0_9HYPH|nr:serine--tRNA ligase [Salinarimonas soli]KAA2235368.1 serine--tRNA ligase [Salinarimonas soli]